MQNQYQLCDPGYQKFFPKLGSMYDHLLRLTLLTQLLHGDALFVATASHRYIRDECGLSARQNENEIYFGLERVISRETYSAKKRDFLDLLREHGGEPKDPCVEDAILELSKCNPIERYIDAELERALQGKWTSVSRPDFPDGKGKNSAGDYQFTLGRMSFGAFYPKSLLCSIQGIDNTIEKLENTHVSGISRGDNDPPLYSYDVSVKFAIEDECPCKGDVGLLVTKGYCQRDTRTPSRFTVWFSGGELRPLFSEDMDRWEEVFGSSFDASKLSWKEYFQDVLARWFLGFKRVGTSKFQFSRLIGGQGKAYVDILYLDDDLRITRGNRGSIVIACRS